VEALARQNARRNNILLMILVVLLFFGALGAIVSLF